jgi:crotonobetainyl-CoA:carnitine CoA-transferase CaiB-like acyl-CoA transferase
MAAIGILAALFAREVTGAGQLVDVAMLDGAFAWQVVNLLQASRQGEALRRGATVLTGRHPCYALYETKDGRWLAVGALEPHFWRNLCARLGLPELYAAQFAEGGERDEAFRRLGARFRERTQADWARELADLEVCVSPVATLAEALEDPQLGYRQMVVPVAEGSERPRAALGHPIKLSATPATRHRPAPRLGQHTGEVLGALGYSGADLARLRERGVV